jgi:plastocyanin
VRPRREGTGRIAAVLSAGLLAVAPAAGADQEVGVQFAQFVPSTLDVLPSETVQWANVSPRAHTVTADAFASGELVPGATFAWTAGLPGAYPYRCSIHPEMTGEIDVRRVTLGPLPPAAVIAGTRLELTGRTADPPTPVRIERDRGDGFAQVTVAAASPSGDWHATVTAVTTADYRAVTGAETSETRRLLVSNRRVTVRVSRRGMAVTVTPADPYGQVVLEQRLRERFGWWPVARKRLDYLSHSRFRLRRRARTRVVLVDRDGWTPLAVSRAFRAPARRSRRPLRARGRPALVRLQGGDHDPVGSVSTSRGGWAAVVTGAGARSFPNATSATTRPSTAKRTAVAKADWNPFVSAESGSLPRAWETATVERIATPTAPPIWNEELLSPDARPASDSPTPASDAIEPAT